MGKIKINRLIFPIYFTERMITLATMIYDVEVFPHNWMVGFKILETNEYVQIWDDYDEIIEFIKNNKDSFLIGFNSSYYDDIILETILKKLDPYPVSVDMIDNRIRKRSYLRLRRMDLMEGMLPGISLKSLQSEMGMSIEESEIDFMMDRPLTEEEKELTNKYNRHDLDSTHRLLEHRWDGFVKVKLDLIKYFGLSPNTMKDTMATMVAKGLGAKRTSHPPRHFEWYDSLHIKNPEVVDFIKNEKFLTENLLFELGGIEHKIGLGGIHAAREAYQSDNFWIIDVVGYYSLIQMNLNLMSRSLPPEGKKKYNGLYWDRIERKLNNDPSEFSLKIGVLSVWGAMLNEWQLLSDISTGNLIMITGQAFIIDLIEKLEPYITLIQSNTDGIFVEPHDEEKVKEIVNEWVKRTGFEVSIDKGKKLYQKDVNNYVCVVNDKKVVAKGSYVNKYDIFDNQRSFQFMLTRGATMGAVVDKALVNYLLHDIPVEDTINNETDPRYFMFTIRKGARTYSHVELHITEEGSDEVIIEKTQNVNRVFVSNDSHRDMRIYKVKDGKPHVFPSMDVNVFIFNDDLKNFTQDDMNRINREYYIRRAKEKIEDFLTLRPKKKSTKNNTISLRLWEGFEKEREVSNEELVKTIKVLPDGESRMGDLTINRIGEYFTFTEKRGKSNVVHLDKIVPDLFKIRYGKLNRKRITIMKKVRVIITERDTDALIQYQNDNDPSDNFEAPVNTYIEAFEYLAEAGLIDQETLESVKPEEKEVNKNARRSKETVELDNDMYITWESFDRGEGTEWEVILKEKENIIRQVDADTLNKAHDIVMDWIKEYYEKKK